MADIKQPATVSQGRAAALVWIPAIRSTTPNLRAQRNWALTWQALPGLGFQRGQYICQRTERTPSMPDIGYSPEIQPDIASRRGWMAGRAVLACAIVVGVALAALTTPAAEVARAAQAAGPELTRLLRTMAVLKLMFAVGMLAAVYWRLSVAAATWRLASYAAAGAAMAAGPVLIWEMAHLRLGALLLHGGLLAGGLLLWRDPAVGARLGAIVSRRRTTIRARG